MTQFSITVPDNKLNFFIELINSIDFLKINEKNILPEIPEWHKPIIDENLKKYYENPENVVDWEVAQKEIESIL